MDVVPSLKVSAWPRPVRILISMLVAGALAVSASVPASAAPQLDQDNLNATVAGFNPLGNYNNGGTVENWELGMTFTAGVSGTLVAVQVVLQRVWADELSIDIYSATGTPPASVLDTLLSTQALTSAQVAAIPATMETVQLDLTDPVPVTAGEQYAFVLRSSTPYQGSGAAFYADYSSGGPYSRGNGILRRTPPGTTSTGSDYLLFATYVERPTSAIVHPPAWEQAYGRSESELCRKGWNPSWARWPNSGAGGFVCVRTLNFEASTGAWVTR